MYWWYNGTILRMSTLSYMGTKGQDGHVGLEGISDTMEHLEDVLSDQRDMQDYNETILKMSIVSYIPVWDSETSQVGQRICNGKLGHEWK